MLSRKLHHSALVALLVGPFSGACSNVGVVGGVTTKKSEDTEDEKPENSGDAEGQGEADAGESDGTDLPVWVNGTLLRCQWDGAESETEARIDCGLVTTKGQWAVPAETVDLKWVVVGPDGKDSPAKQHDTGGTKRVERTFIVDAASAAGLTIALSVKGKVAEGRKVVLADKLPGLKAGDALRGCLETKAKDVATCLEDHAPVSTPLAQADGANTPQGPGSSDPATHDGGVPVRTRLRVFITDATFTGNLDGLQGADQKCTDAANAQGINGKFMALLSVPGVPVRGRITKQLPFEDLNGKAIAADAMALFGQGRGTIKISEKMAEVSGKVWSGSSPVGLAAPTHCDSWRTGTIPGTAVYGDNTETNQEWIADGEMPCALAAHLYCVEK